MGDYFSIDAFSKYSLLLQLEFDGCSCANATGFVVKRNGKYYLITNWHVLSGRHPIDNKPLDKKNSCIPNNVNIFHHSKNFGNWVNKIEPLGEFDDKNWIEHPRGREFDVAALPLTQIDNEIQVYDLDVANKAMNMEKNMKAELAMPVSIVGFPNGKASTRIFPIWKTGHIASEPETNYYDDTPIFYIDAITRGGMSGSPVYIRSFGTYRDKQNRIYVEPSKTFTRFLGIYSSRIDEGEGIGEVWRPNVIEEILETV